MRGSEQDSILGVHLRSGNTVGPILWMAAGQKSTSWIIAQVHVTSQEYFEVKLNMLQY